MRRRWLAVSIFSASAFASAGDVQPTTSEAFAFATYRVRAGAVTVLVDAYPAALHAEDAYIPLSVAVGYTDRGPGITVTAESFTLIDSTGMVHAAVPYGEFIRNYSKREFDAELLRNRPLVAGQQFDTSIKLPARFYPTVATGGTRMERVELAPYTWFSTLIYFPRPRAGWDGVMTLRLSGGGVQPPVEVRFRIPKLGK